jgi:hypothetical protein
MSFDVAVERSVLGAWLIDPALVPAALERLTRECFASPAHAAVFDAIGVVYKRAGGLSTEAIEAELRAAKVLTLVGEGYLARVRDELSTTLHYRDQLSALAKHGQRRVKNKSVDRLKAALDSGAPADVVQQIAAETATTFGVAAPPPPPGGVLERLAERASADPGLPFDEGVVEAAAALAARPYEVLVAELKRAGVRVVVWERAVRAARDAAAARVHPAPRAPGPDVDEQGRRFNGPYVEDAEGIWTSKRDPSGARQRDEQLSDWTARIVANVREVGHEGARNWYQIEATVGGRGHTLRVPAGEYESMAWVAQELGADAVIPAGRSTKDRLRDAIQRLSRPIPRREVFTFTGWHRVGREWAYLHAGGAIGAAGVLDGVATELPAAFAPFTLPAPPEGAELRAALRASLALFSLEPVNVLAPVFACVWRAALGPCTATVMLAAAPHAGKTLLASLAQMHFGSAMDERHVPAAWKQATAASLNQMRATIGDAVYVIDDYTLSGGAEDQKLSEKLDLVVRAQHGGAGARRLSRDLSLRAEAPVRSTLLSTGELPPRGHSLRSRMLVVELHARLAADLTAHREAGRAGTYAAAMAGFVQWLAPRLDAVRAELPRDAARFAQMLAPSDDAQRTAAMLGELAAGLGVCLQFAQDVGALAADEAVALWERAWRGFAALAGEQRAHQAAQEPASRFLALVASAVASGACHVAHKSGGMPEDAAGWGWRWEGDGPADAHTTRGAWRARGRCVGWTDGSLVWLLHDVALEHAAALAKASGDPLALNAEIIAKRLHERGLLAKTDAARGCLTTRLRVNGQDQHRLLCVAVAKLFSGGEAPADAAVGGEAQGPPE